MRCTALLAAAAVATGCAAARAADDAGSSRKVILRPHLLDAEGGTGATLALDYDLSFSRAYATPGNTSVGSMTVDPADPDVRIGEGGLDFRARGTIAANKAKTPHKLLEFTGSAHYTLSQLAFWSRAGAQVAYETDQEMKNRQAAFSLFLAASRVQLLTNGDAFSVIGRYGTVDPKEDTARQALGVGLGNYRRWDAEVSYSLNTNLSKLRSVDFNYRYFQEVAAPAAVRGAGLDRHRLGLVRLNLDGDWFLQYASGSLPFDQQSQRSVKAGLTYKFN